MHVTLVLNVRCMQDDVLLLSRLVCASREINITRMQLSVTASLRRTFHYFLSRLKNSVGNFAL